MIGGRLMFSSDARIRKGWGIALPQLRIRMHDLGLTDRYTAENRFEVDGANAARSFLKGRGISMQQMQVVWDAIALHTTRSIALHKEPEVAMTHSGITADVLGAAAVGVDRKTSREVRMDSTISTKDLKSKLDKKQAITVVETLAPERYREAHLPGALNIPPERIKELAPQLLPNKDAVIVTYCTNLH
jgi:hypothetical protein